MVMWHRMFRQGRELISLHHLDCVGVYDHICTFVAPTPVHLFPPVLLSVC